MPIDPAFHHIGVTVRDLDRSLHFYHDVFGLDPKLTLVSERKDEGRIKRVAFLAFGSALMEIREAPPSATDPTLTALDRDSIGYAYPGFVVEDLAAARAELLAKGYQTSEPIIARGESAIAGTIISFLTDPDGKDIELLQVSPGLTVDALSAAPAMSLEDAQDYVITPL